MARRQTPSAWWTLYLYAILAIYLVTPTLSFPWPEKNGLASPNTTLPTLSSKTISLRAGTTTPKAIEPPTPKFKTTPDKGALPELDLSVLAKNNLSFYDDEKMEISSTRFMPGMYQARNPVGNGYFGTTLAAAGPFFEVDVNQTNHDGNVTEGWPLFNARQTFATIAGFFDVQETTPRTNFAQLAHLGWESVISGIPYPLTLNLVVGDSVLNSTVDRDTISDYTKIWKLQDGLTQWNYVWRPRDTKVSFDVEYVVFISREDANVASTQLRVTSRGGDYNASIIDMLDGRSAERSHLVQKEMMPEAPQIYVSVHPEGLPNITAYIVSTVNVSNGFTVESSRRKVSSENNMTIGQEWDVQLIDGETAVFQKFVGVASFDKFPSPASMAEAASSGAAKRGWYSVLSDHTKAWNTLMQRILIADYRDPVTGRLPTSSPFIERLQAAAVVDRHVILSNLQPEDGNGLNDAGVAPTGLFSDSYGGMIFWDQDLWIKDSILATSPEYAVQIPKSRAKLYGQAKANAQMPYVKNDSNTYYDFDNQSVIYAWMNGRYGNATATGPAKDYQYHLNTDIALSMLQTRRVTGNETLFREEFWPVIKSVAHTITTLLKRDGNGWSVFNVTDPDEYAASVDNGAYLLSSMSSILHETILLQTSYREAVDTTWIDMANNVNIPRSSVSNITKEYEGMTNNITVKQADIALISYPWHNNQDFTLKQKRNDLNYYTQKQNPDGPAMTYAINAIVENQIGDAGCSATTYHGDATIPYLRAPWFLMSEVPNDDVNGNGGVPPAFPFVTGHGGAAQIPLFGYLGLDLTRNSLTISPSLPPPIVHLRLPAFYFQGSRFMATMNLTHTILSRLDSKDTTVVHDVYANELVPVFIGSPGSRRGLGFSMLAINQTLTIENDMYWQTTFTKGNLVQCRPTTSESESVLGQWPVAATDGNPTTKWQPLTTNRTSLILNMTGVVHQAVVQLNFDWGTRPPKNVRVAFTNDPAITSIEDEHMNPLDIINVGSIEPNQPPHIFNETEPTPYIGNTTIYVINSTVPVYTRNYAILEVQGCNGCGSMNSWTGGNGTMFNPQDNTFGATVGEFEIIGADREVIV